MNTATVDFRHGLRQIGAHGSSDLSKNNLGKFQPLHAESLQWAGGKYTDMEYKLPMEDSDILTKLRNMADEMLIFPFPEFVRKALFSRGQLF